MITYEIIKECLDILEVNYTDLTEENGGIAVCFFDKETFSHEIYTNIHVVNDELVSFISYADDYHPEGDLLAMANRHNYRSHSPRCYIDDDGDVIMHQAFVLAAEVSPNYILKDVIQATISLTMEAFSNFELDMEEFSSRFSNKD
ncbi:MAG: YbjN domain-containing protein [Muribaculaceae bacterium]|nr:YbjN domain-containing protein [Muribaculaceae bacterium]